MGYTGGRWAGSRRFGSRENLLLNGQVIMVDGGLTIQKL